MSLLRLPSWWGIPASSSVQRRGPTRRRSARRPGRRRRASVRRAASVRGRQETWPRAANRNGPARKRAPAPGNWSTRRMPPAPPRPGATPSWRKTQTRRPAFASGRRSRKNEGRKRAPPDGGGRRSLGRGPNLSEKLTRACRGRRGPWRQPRGGNAPAAAERRPDAGHRCGRLGSARLGSARLGSARLGSALNMRCVHSELPRSDESAQAREGSTSTPPSGARVVPLPRTRPQSVSSHTGGMCPLGAAPYAGPGSPCFRRLHDRSIVQTAHKPRPAGRPTAADSCPVRDSVAGLRSL